MLNALTLILVCQLAGELVSGGLHLPVPGPVIGMVVLFIYLMVRGGVSQTMGKTADGLLSHLSLLFVPAGVGLCCTSGCWRITGLRCRWRCWQALLRPSS